MMLTQPVPAGCLETPAGPGPAGGGGIGEEALEERSPLRAVTQSSSKGMSKHPSGPCPVGHHLKRNLCQEWLPAQQ